jgi:hypothetical protein
MNEEKSVNINFLSIFHVLSKTMYFEYRLCMFGAMLFALMRRIDQKEALKHQTNVCKIQNNPHK